MERYNNEIRFRGRMSRRPGRAYLMRLDKGRTYILVRGFPIRQ
jgi:hypothetical protein